MGYNKDKYTSTEVRCCHCEADHQVLSRNNPIFKRETEILLIQAEECKPRLQAIQKLLRLNQNPELIFLNAVKNTYNPTTSASPTRSKQESQSDSSEDNSPTVPAYGYGYNTKEKEN